MRNTLPYIQYEEFYSAIAHHQSHVPWYNVCQRYPLLRGLSLLVGCSPQIHFPPNNLVPYLLPDPKEFGAKVVVFPYIKIFARYVITKWLYSLFHIQRKYELRDRPLAARYLSDCQDQFSYTKHLPVLITSLFAWTWA